MDYTIDRFKNVTVALNTPFKENGDVDLDTTRKLVNYLYEAEDGRTHLCLLL